MGVPHLYDNAHPFVPNCVLSEGCTACIFLHVVQGILHLMQGLPAGANTRPKGGVIGVFVRTKTLLALTQKSPQSSEKCVTTFPYRFRQEKPPTIFGRLDGLDLNLVRIGSYSYYQDALLSKPSLSPFRAFSRYPLAS